MRPITIYEPRTSVAPKPVAISLILPTPGINSPRSEVVTVAAVMNDIFDRSRSRT